MRCGNGKHESLNISDLTKNIPSRFVSVIAFIEVIWRERNIQRKTLKVKATVENKAAIQRRNIAGNTAAQFLCSRILSNFGEFIKTDPREEKCC